MPVRGLLGLVAPPRCGACGAPGVAVESLCGACAGELRAATPALEAGPGPVELSCAAGPYEGVIRDLVTGLKFGRRLALAGPAAAAIARACPASELRGELAPVPPAPLRWRWRGFDPAEEIAIELARRTGLRLSACLERSQGPRQARRSRLARTSAPPEVRLTGAAPERAVLVDDVHTTGATLAACARALREGGCRSVLALTLARAGAPGSILHPRVRSPAKGERP